jgi:hypothetical protein
MSKNETEIDLPRGGASKKFVQAQRYGKKNESVQRNEGIKRKITNGKTQKAKVFKKKIFPLK